LDGTSELRDPAYNKFAGKKRDNHPATKATSSLATNRLVIIETRTGFKDDITAYTIRGSTSLSGFTP